MLFYRSGIFVKYQFAWSNRTAHYLQYYRFVLAHSLYYNYVHRRNRDGYILGVWTVAKRIIRQKVKIEFLPVLSCHVVDSSTLKVYTMCSSSVVPRLDCLTTHQYIFWLDVPVYNVQGVQVADGTGEVVQHPAGVFLSVAARCGECIKQVSSLDKHSSLMFQFCTLWNLGADDPPNIMWVIYYYVPT